MSFVNDPYGGPERVYSKFIVESSPIWGDPFITFAERGRGGEKFDQNANAVKEVA